MCKIVSVYFTFNYDESVSIFGLSYRYIFRLRYYTMSHTIQVFFKSLLVYYDLVLDSLCSTVYFFSY